MTAVEDTREVRVEDAVPVRGLHGGHVDEASDASVVDQDVEPAEPRGGGFDGARRVAGTPDVGCDGRQAIRAAQLAGRGLQSCLVGADDDDEGVSGEQIPGGRQADAARAASHECRASVQRRHQWPVKPHVYNTVAMHTVAILGAGDLGAETARALACQDLVTRILLVDAAAAVAAGKALDIQQSGPVEGFDTRLDGTADLTRLMGADVVVLADDYGLGEIVGERALQLVERAHQMAPRAVLLAAGAGQRAVLGMAMRELRIPATRLIGAAPLAAVSAARALVAMDLAASPAEVSLTVLGAPPGWIVGWTDGSLGGTPLTQLLTPPRIARIERQLQSSWPAGVYQLASAAAAVVGAMFTESRRRLCCFASDGDRLGTPVHVAVPVLLGPTGIREIHTPRLDARDRIALDALLRA